MGHSNIYIRKENEVAWGGISDKSAWVNERLQKWHPLMGASDTSVGNSDKVPAVTLKDLHASAKALDKLADKKGTGVTTDPPLKFCKHGAHPDMCKFKKPGKPCK